MTDAEPAARVAIRQGPGGLTIAALFYLVWSRRWMFLASAVLAVALVVSYAFLATPYYRVTVKLVPRQGDNSPGALQGLLGQFGGLASMFGGLGSPVDEQEALALLKSRALMESFVNRESLMPVFFADEWDSARKEWRSDVKRAPTMDDAWELFDRRIRTVNQDSKSRVVTLEVNWRDRVLAAAWANDLVTMANEELRRRALHQATATLESLEQQLKTTDAVELRQSIYRLMEVQVNRMILANSRPDYAFAVLDPAVVPDARRFTSPRRGLLLVIAIPFGIFAGVCAVVGLEYLRSLRHGWRRFAPSGAY